MERPENPPEGARYFVKCGDEHFFTIKEPVRSVPHTVECEDMEHGGKKVIFIRQPVTIIEL